MAIMIGHASIDENNKISGGSAGDQTGKEVCTRSYYLHSKGWYLLRPKNPEHANAIAEAMLRACNNDNIGYDQGNRLGIIKYGTTTKTKTECDCSSLVRQCVKEGTGKDAGNFTTSNEKTVLLATGLFENAISVTSSTIVYNGDVLVTKTKGHTVIVVSGNPRITTTTTSNYLSTASTYTRTQFIKDVQKAIGTTADGIVGNKTLSKLVTVSKSKNARHAVVKPLQKYLNTLGYNCGTVDGVAGPKFDSAAKAWAKANGCVADGEFTKGGKSWPKILGV